MSLTGSSLIFKFGELAHLRALQRGAVYMKPWTYFSAAEKDAERDSNEGTHVWFNPAQTKIEIAGHEFTSAGGTLSLSLKFPDTRTKVFCASKACRENCKLTGPIFENRMAKHGAHLLVITDVKSFGAQLVAALTSSQEKKEIGRFGERRVIYFDQDSYDGPVCPFLKASQFAFEKEWRLVVLTANESDQPFTLEIGSIEGSSILMETKDFKNKVECRSDGSVNLDF